MNEQINRTIALSWFSHRLRHLARKQTRLSYSTALPSTQYKIQCMQHSPMSHSVC